jgi:branched-chain amino acid transport system permease protein
MVLLGGVETVSGAVIGAIVYKALSIWLVSYTELSKLVLGGMIVLIVVAFPKGIAGTFGNLVDSGRLPFFKRALPRASQAEGAE